MRRRGFVSVAGTLLFLIAAASTARAEELGGKFGLGADTALGLSSEAALVPGGGGGGRASDSLVLRQSFQIPGLAATFYLTDLLGLELIASVQIDDGDLAVGSGGGLRTEDTTVTTLGFGFRVLLALVREDTVHLSVATGATFVWSEIKLPPDPDYQQYRLSAEIGLRPEWFVSEHFSLHTQMGISFSLYSYYPGPDDNNRSGIDLSIFGNLNLVGNAGFTWWF